MSFIKSLSVDAGPRYLYTKYPEIYGPWANMSQALMNGPSPLSQGERELIFAYAAGVAGCKYVSVAHSEAAYAWGIENGVIESLLKNPETAPLEARLKILLAFVRKLMLTPGEMSQADGWLKKLLARRNKNIAAVALAAKNARVAWALLKYERSYECDYAATRPGLVAAA